MDCEIEHNKVSKKASYEKAFKAAFPYTIPVMTGYLFIGNRWAPKYSLN